MRSTRHHPSRRTSGRAAVAGWAVVMSLAAAPAAARAEGERAHQAAPAAIAAGTAHSELARMGEWISAAGRGRAWRPRDVAPDWRPYFHGSWTWTLDGWFWVSEEPWGWLTYHYGRWIFEPAHGWVWLPGKAWAPAWVTWRSSREFVGWAPLSPEGTPLSAFWTFVAASQFARRRVADSAVSATRVPALMLQTRRLAPAPSASDRARAARSRWSETVNPALRAAGGPVLEQGG